MPGQNSAYSISSGVLITVCSHVLVPRLPDSWWPSRTPQCDGPMGRFPVCDGGDHSGRGMQPDSILLLRWIRAAFVLWNNPFYFHRPFLLFLSFTSAVSIGDTQWTHRSRVEGKGGSCEYVCRYLLLACHRLCAGFWDFHSVQLNCFARRPTPESFVALTISSKIFYELFLPFYLQLHVALWQ